MKKNVKKVLTIILAVILVLQTGFTVFAGGWGSSSRGGNKGGYSSERGSSKKAPAPAEEAAPEVTEETAEPVETEEPAEEAVVAYPAQSFDVDVETVDVKVSVEAPEGALPDGAELEVVKVDDAEVEEQVASVTDGPVDEMLALDISFTTGEPEGEVEVVITSDKIAENADKALELIHIKDDGTVEKIENFEVDGDTLKFTSAEFSTYTLTWREGNNNRSATIHVGYLNSNNNNFTELTTATASLDTSGDSIDLKAFAESVIDTSKYAYIGARYSATANTGSVNELSGHTITKNANGSWQAQVVTGNNNATTSTTIANGSHIYIFCEDKGAGSYVPPKPEGSSVNPESVNPNFAKTVTKNTDGTYTIKLDITGHQAPVQQGQGANVIIVFDTTKSMRYDMEGNDPGSYSSTSTTTRMYAAKAALRTLISTLKPGDGTGGTNAVNVNFIQFNNGNTSTGNWSSNQTTLNQTINDLRPVTGSGTNWEEGLVECENLLATIPNNDNLKNNKTYVIFITDGDPNKCQEANLDDYHYNAAAAAHAQDNANNVANNAYLYGVFCGASAGADRLETLITTANGEQTIAATSQTALEAAFANIGAIITSNLGSHSVNMDDGLPSLASIQHTVSGEATDFKYYKNDVEWTGSDVPQATYDASNGVVWDLSTVGTLENDTKYSIEFTIWPTQASYDLIADLNNKLIYYNYAAYVADGGELTEEEAVAQRLVITEGERNQVDAHDDGTYTLKTNTHLKASYVNEVNGETYTPDNISYQGQNMPLPTETISVKKIWPENMLDAYGAAAYRKPDGTTDYATQIKLTLQREGEDYLEVIVSKDGPDGIQDGTYTDEAGVEHDAKEDNWTKDDIYISCGQITVKNGEVDIKEPGHDYQIIEPEAFLYYWDLISDVYRPMVINGTATVLVYDPDLTEADNVNSFVLGEDVDEEGNKTPRVYKKQSDTSNNTLNASNYRRSNLNLYKVLPKEDKDSYFTYTATVKDSYSTDGKVWFSAFEPVLKADGTPELDDKGNVRSKVVYKDWVLSGATAEVSVLQLGDDKAHDVQYHAADEDHPYAYFTYYWGSGTTLNEVPAVNDDVTAPQYKTGYYYADNGATITFKIKGGWDASYKQKGWDSFPGWNVRFLNLYHGSTYSFEETGMPNNYEFDKIEADTQYDILLNSNKDWYTIETTGEGEAAVQTGKITGTITEPNNNYKIAYSNKLKPEFYIYHSGVAGDGNLETIPIPKAGTTPTGNWNSDGTYNLYAHTTAGTLYGGYYLNYEGKGDYKDDGVKGTTGVAYTGMNYQKWADCEPQTVDGEKITPVAGETYYIKEVPTYYLRNYHQINYVKSDGKLMALYLISAVDDLNYQTTGLTLQTDDGKVSNVCLNMNFKNAATGKIVTLKANTIFKSIGITETGEYLTYWDATNSDYFAVGNFTIKPYWITPDSITVHGISTRKITITAMTKSGISKEDK